MWRPNDSIFWLKQSLLVHELKNASKCSFTWQLHFYLLTILLFHFFNDCYLQLIRNCWTSFSWWTFFHSIFRYNSVFWFIIQIRQSCLFVLTTWFFWVSDRCCLYLLIINLYLTFIFLFLIFFLALLLIIFITKKYFSQWWSKLHIDFKIFINHCLTSVSD